jgi:hypothetical protein
VLLLVRVRAFACMRGELTVGALRSYLSYEIITSNDTRLLGRQLLSKVPRAAHRPPHAASLPAGRSGACCPGRTRPPRPST